jgi:redox-sensitive bicupin YhaK (pirin superfamily)
MTIASAVPDGVVEQLILPPVRDLGGGFMVRRALPSAHRRMVGPFIFFDQFGPTVFGANEGQDTRPHPHIGLSTLTYLIEGEIVHRDSAGHTQTIRSGEVNWMTAGNGIVHSERWDPRTRARGGSMFGQQIWIALPKEQEERAPDFSNHSAASLPRFSDTGVAGTVVAGSAFGLHAPVPTFSDLMYVDVVLQPGARFQIKAQHMEQAIFVVSGGVEVEGQTGIFGETQLVVFKPDAEIVVRATELTRLMLIGGEPFPEQRHIYWNFVSSSKERIEQAKEDWRLGRFPEIAGETEFIPLPPDPPRAASAD